MKNLLFCFCIWAFLMLKPSHAVVKRSFGWSALPSVTADSLSSKQKEKAVRKPTAVSKFDFEGIWKGNERCQGISAAVAFITISAKSETEVYIKGLYSTEGDIIGLWKGESISIPRQLIPDPLFKNMRIEGNLSLSKNRRTLSAVFNVLNNDARDQCSAIYNR